MIEGTLHFWVDGGILFHELVYLANVNLSFNVLKHHLIVAELNDQLPIELLYSWILIL